MFPLLLPGGSWDAPFHMPTGYNPLRLGQLGVFDKIPLLDLCLVTNATVD